MSDAELIAKLAALVKTAYEEGFEAGCSADRRGVLMNEDWADSDALLELRALVVEPKP